MGKIKELVITAFITTIKLIIMTLMYILLLLLLTHFTVSSREIDIITEVSFLWCTIFKLYILLSRINVLHIKYVKHESKKYRLETVIIYLIEIFVLLMITLLFNGKYFGYGIRREVKNKFGI